MTNFIPYVQGPAANRSGFKYIADTKNADETSRLIPFEFSTTQAYIIEAGEDYFRFYMNSGQLQSVASTTVLLLSSNGSDADTTFTDDSPTTPHTITANGDAQLDTEYKKFGTASGLYDGTGDYLTTPDDADFDLSADDGGFDAWIKPVAGNSSQYTLFHQDQTGDSQVYMKGYLTWYTGLLLNGNGDDESTTISDTSLNTKTLTRSGNTSLLLHGTGEDESVNIIDSSSTVHTITRHGTSSGPEIDTAQYVFNDSSILFDRSDVQYLQITRHADFNFSGGTYTMKMRIRPNSLSTNLGLFEHKTDTSNTHYLRVASNGSLQYGLVTAGAGVLLESGAGTISSGQWYDIEISRDDSTDTYRMFVDGTLADSDVDATIPGYYAGDIYIGSRDSGAQTFDGWIDDLHMLKGIALHTANFTSATTAHAAVEIDTSDPKFGTGEIRFGGQDYLFHTGSEDTNFGAGAGSADIFTVSMFIKPDTVSGTQYLMDFSGASNYGVYLFLNNNILTALVLTSGGTETFTHSTSVDTDWQHIAFVSDGTNVNLYLDGVEDGKQALSGSLPDMSAFDIFIGVDDAGANGYTGLMDDLKMMKNERYDVDTASLTVPTTQDRYVAHAAFELGDTVPTVDTVEMPDDDITPDKFHHIEMNYDVSEPQVYMFTDGQLHSGGVQAMTLTADGSLNELFYIGSETDGTTNEFKGWIDEIRFVKGALSNITNFTPNVVEYLTLGTTTYEIAHTYTESELAELQWCQSADTLYIVHPNHFPAQLTRTGHVNWTLSDVAIVNAPITWAVGSYPSSVAFFEDRLWFAYYQTLFGSQAGDYTNFIPNDAGSAETQAAASWTTATDLVTVASNTATWLNGYKVQLTTSDTLPSGLSLATDYYIYRSDSTHIGFATTAANAYAGTLIDFTDQGVGNHTITLADSCSGDACAMQYTIASNNVNEIQWLSSGKILVAGTSGGEYKVSASTQDDALTPTNIRIVKQSSYGSEGLMPLTIRDVVLYVQRKARKIREFAYDFTNDIYVSPDLTLLSEHITESGIKYMDYQSEPNSIVWIVKENGDLIGMTYARDNETVAWHKHTTDGEFESIAVIPSIEGNDYEEVWVIVKRNINGSDVRYIEQLQPQFGHSDNIEDAFFVDSGLSYNGVATSSLTGLSHLEGETVSILADGVVQASKTVSSGAITLDSAASIVHVGLPYTSTLQTMRYTGNSNKGTLQGQEKRIPKVVVRLENAKQFQYGHSASGNLKTKTLSSLTTGDIELTMPLGINREGYVAIVNTKPLPITVIAIIPEVNSN